MVFLNVILYARVVLLIHSQMEFIAPIEGDRNLL